MKQKNNSLWCLVVLAFLMLCCDNRSTTQVPSNVTKGSAKKAVGALVIVEMKNREGQPLGYGSGFFVGQEQVVTCSHVIAGATSGTIRLVGTELKSNVEGIITDEKNGLALLKVSDFGVPPVTLGNSDTVQIGKEIRVVGNPQFGWNDKVTQENKVALIEGAITSGEISDVPEGSAVEHLGYSSGNPEFSPDEILQITAQIDPSSSGCPVLNDIGEVIGIAFMSFEGTDNLNFVIPSNFLKELLDHQKAPTESLAQEQTISAYNYYLWGHKKVRQRQYEAAIADFDEAILLDRDYDSAYNDRGAAKIGLGQYASAIADFDEAIHLKPDYVGAYSNRGIAKAGLGQYASAIADFDEAIHLKPDLAEAYRNRGLTKEKLEQHEAAIADYDAAIHLKPDYAEVYLYRGMVKQFLEQYASAIRDYDAAIQLILPKDDLVTAYYNRGLAKQFLRQHKAAIADYDAAIRLKPDLASAYNDRGVAKVGLGQYASAIADYDAAIHLKPDLAEAYHNRGVAKRSMGQYKSSITDFDTAISLGLPKPSLVQAYNSRGISKSFLGQHKEAIADFDEVINLKPDYAEAYYNRGVEKYSLGQHNSAIADYNMAIHLNSDLAEAYLHRGMAKTVLNRIDEAKSDLQTALRLTQQTGNKDLKDKNKKIRIVAEQSLQNLD